MERKAITDAAAVRWGPSLGALMFAASLTAYQSAQAEPVQSGQSSPGKDSDVVVTALKTGAQVVERVPVAIQVFGVETLNNRGVRDGSDLIQLIPGASEAQEIGAGYRIFSFRGSGAGGPIGDGMIGYYLDDTPFGIPNNQSAPPLQYFDIDRVEVLRGPQGTLYGQGSMGGTIIYHTKNPSLTRFQASAEGLLSSTSEASLPNYRAAVALSIPLVRDVLGVRVSGGYDYRAGVADIYQGAPVGTPYLQDANDVIGEDVQAVLLWRPMDRLSVRLRAWRFSIDQNYLNVINSLDPPYAANQGTVHGYDRRPAVYYSGTITYQFDKLTLTNATSYQKSLPGGFGVGLGLGPPLGVGTLINGGHAENLVDELRLSTSGQGPLHWVGGVFLQRATGLYLFSLSFPTLNLNGDTITRTRNASVFSEVGYELFGGKLVPLVGLRYFTDRRSSFSHSNGVPVSSSAHPDALTWRANLAYYPSSGWMLFFNAGTGFRSGILQSQAQADAVIADGVPSSISLTPDKLLNLEVGAKGNILNGRVHLAVSAYRIKYSNLQSAYATSIGLAAFANLGDATTHGFDIEASWDTPLEGLTLSVIGNVNTSEFTNVVPAFANANPRVANGQQLLNTPPYNWRADAFYEHRFGRWTFFADASATAVGRTRNGDPTVNILQPYQLYRADFGVRLGDYEFRLFGENLSDERGPTAANGPTLLAGPRPRTFGASVRFNMQ
jgi:iron complex outermembrane receptor protein